MKECLVVIGEFVLEESIYGESYRISPEAPVPIIEVKNTELRLGGVPLILNHLNECQEHVHFYSIRGNKDSDGLLDDFLNGLRMHHNIFLDETFEIRETKRIIAGKQKVLEINNIGLWQGYVDDFSAYIVNHLNQICGYPKVIALEGYEDQIANIYNRILKNEVVKKAKFIVDSRNQAPSNFPRAFLAILSLEWIKRNGLSKQNIKEEMAEFSISNILFSQQDDIYLFDGQDEFVVKDFYSSDSDTNLIEKKLLAYLSRSVFQNFDIRQALVDAKNYFSNSRC